MTDESLLSPGMSLYEPLKRNNPFHRYEGFWIDDVHSSTLGLYRVSSNNRYSDPVFANLKNESGDNPGNGAQYFGSFFTSKSLKLDLAFDNVNVTTITFLRQLGNGMAIHTIRFDEFPNVVWQCVLRNPPTFKFVPFDRPQREKSEDKQWTIEESILYKGECTLNFEVYKCFGEDNFTYKYVSEKDESGSGEEGLRQFPCRVYRAAADETHFELVIDGGFRKADEDPVALEEILKPLDGVNQYTLTIDAFDSPTFDVKYEKDKFDSTKLRLTCSAPEQLETSDSPEVPDSPAFSTMNTFVNEEIVPTINRWGCYPARDNLSHLSLIGKRIDVYDIGQAGAGLSVYNPGDIECDYKLWIYNFEFLYPDQEWDKSDSYDIAVVNEIADLPRNLDMSIDFSHARLFQFENLTLYNGDVGIVIDTKTRLVHGLDPNGNATFSLYNKFLVRENWYKLRYLRSHFSVGRANNIGDGTIQSRSHLKNYTITFKPIYL